MAGSDLRGVPPSSMSRSIPSFGRYDGNGRDVKYQVFVDDNFHYMDESERYELGQFETLDAAVDACRKIVDEFLVSAYSPGMTEAELVTQYVLFGDDPFVYTGDGTVPFSARDYARRRAAEICRDR